MAAALEVFEDTSTVVLRLPPRDLGWFRAIGGCTLLLAAVVAAIFYAIIVWLPQAGGAPALEDFLIPGIVAGIGLLLFFISTIPCQTEVRVGSQYLQITESIGWIRWTRGCPIGRIRRFAIRHLFTQHRQQSAPLPKPDDRAILIVECRGHPELQFAHGYTRQQLLEFADELASRCSEGMETAIESEQPIEVVEQDEATLFEERETQPIESSVHCEHHSDGVTLVVPPDRFWRIVKRAVLTSFPVVFFLCFRLLVIWLEWPNPDWFDCIGVLLGMVALFAIAIHARARTQRQSVFAVVGDQLMVIEVGLFGNRRHEWERADLYDVRIGESLPGRKENQTFELQIWMRDGTKFALLTGRLATELRWMATVLRRALRLPLKREEIAETAQVEKAFSSMQLSDVE